MRFRVPEGDGTDFLDRAHAALRALAERPGYLDGGAGRASDDPTLWLMFLRWESVGAYRRALGAYDVKVAAVPLLSTAIDEPTAFELLADATTRRDSDRTADHGWRRG
ncbi:MAG TPA: antibiotic biosynthesis monooxygenase [Nocardioidaceae bacterium]|nr:antibiotic biosynthesis monooxygenase [Nocardioidaceae bacterium]